MPNLQVKIINDLKKAMLGKEEETVAALRLLISALHNKEISLRKKGKAELANEQVVECLKSEVKKRKDSIIAYQQGQRQDLVQKEEKEIEILEKYLPKQMGDKEIEKVVKEVIKSISEASLKNFGQVMGLAMTKVKGRVDGSKVSEIVKKILSE